MSNVPAAAPAVAPAVEVVAPAVEAVTPVAVESTTTDVLVVPAPINRSNTIKPPQNLSLVLTVCGKALKTYGDQQISSAKILILLQHIVIAVNKLTKLSSDDQKQLALESIHWLIDHQKGLSDEEKNALDLMSEMVFPQAIELLSVAESAFVTFVKWLKVKCVCGASAVSEPVNVVEPVKPTSA